MIQLASLLTTGAADTPRGAGFPLATTSDFALALAGMSVPAGGGVAVAWRPVGAAPVMPDPQFARQTPAVDGKILPPDPLALPLDLIAAPLPEAIVAAPPKGAPELLAKGTSTSNQAMAVPVVPVSDGDPIIVPIASDEDAAPSDEQTPPQHDARHAPDTPIVVAIPVPAAAAPATPIVVATTAPVPAARHTPLAAETAVAPLLAKAPAVAVATAPSPVATGSVATHQPAATPVSPTIEQPVASAQQQPAIAQPRATPDASSIPQIETHAPPQVGPTVAQRPVESDLAQPAAIPSRPVFEIASTIHDPRAPVVHIAPQPVVMPVAIPPAVQVFMAEAIVAPTERDDERRGVEPAILALGGIAAPQSAPEAKAAAQPPLDLTRHDWMNTMIERIETLQGEGGAREARIRLTPDALGTINLTIAHDDDGALQVRFVADTQAARTILADAAPRLAEMADARGLKLGHAGVEAGTGQQHQQPRREAPQSDAPAPNRATAFPAAGDDTDATDTRIA